MSKPAGLLFCILVAVLLAGIPVHAATWEIHPGVYAAYLYTDNYDGVAENPRTESTYTVGPSLAASLATGWFRWDLSGHVAREYHNRFEEDDTTTGSVETRATARGQRQSLDLSYSYDQTRLRETLDEPWGLHKRHTGALTYNQDLTANAVLTLGYAHALDQVPAPDEDIVSDGGDVALRWQISPRNIWELSSAYTHYRHEVSADVDVLESSLRWLYGLTPHLTVGPEFAYEQHRPEDLPEQEIYSPAFFLEYTLSPTVTMTASLGHSWLRCEAYDDQEVTTARLGLRRETAADRFTIDAMYGYTYEYDISGTYGIYKTRSADIAWEHTFTPTLLTTLGYGITQRTPTTNIAEEKETDSAHRLGLTYRPWRWGEGRLTYEHLQHRYEISDTVRENRYGVTIEVRY